MARSRSIHLFADKDASQYPDGVRNHITEVVRREAEDYLLNTDEAEYVAYLASEYSLAPLIIHYDAVTVSSREEMIPASRHDTSRFYVRAGASYPRQVIRYHIPYEGDEDLLEFVPNPRLIWTQEVQLEDGCICFDIIDFGGDAEGITRQADGIIANIKRLAENLAKNVDDFNRSLPEQVKQIVSSRRAEVQKRLGVVGSLGVPIRQSASVPQTFRVPVQRQKVIPKPVVNPKTGLPEPALGEDIYLAILKVIHDTGKVWERLPSTYSDKEEEALRDHFIMVLTPHFEGSTTGETFNKTGKTDILMRYQNSNVFAAECLWWGGSKHFLGKIDQLLSYLTWRDSKAAVICFVGRKDMTNVLKEITQAVPTHACCVREVSRIEETWTNYEFHLVGDDGRNIKLAVLAFHLPRD